MKFSQVMLCHYIDGGVNLNGLNAKVNAFDAHLKITPTQISFEPVPDSYEKRNKRISFPR
jgi:hypothetical protein